MRAILRAAYYELRSRPDVPARVVVTEYVDVAAAFFGPDECGMINAVLDALARQTRPARIRRWTDSRDARRRARTSARQAREQILPGSARKLGARR